MRGSPLLVLVLVVCCTAHTYAANTATTKKQYIDEKVRRLSSLKDELVQVKADQISDRSARHHLKGMLNSIHSNNKDFVVHAKAFLDWSDMKLAVPKGRTSGKAKPQGLKKHPPATALASLLTLLKKYCLTYCEEDPGAIPRQKCSADSDCAGQTGPCTREVCHIDHRCIEVNFCGKEDEGKPCVADSDCNDWDVCTDDWCSHKKCKYTRVPNCDCARAGRVLCAPTESCVYSCSRSCPARSMVDKDTNRCVVATPSSCTAAQKLFCPRENAAPTCEATCSTCPGLGVRHDNQCVSECSEVGQLLCPASSSCVTDCDTYCAPKYLVANVVTSICVEPHTVQVTEEECERQGKKLCRYLNECVTVCLKCPFHLDADGNRCVVRPPVLDATPPEDERTWEPSSGPTPIQLTCGFSQVLEAGIPQVNYFKSLLAGYSGTYPEDDYTLLVPTDDAFANFPAVGSLSPDVADLIIRNHIIPGVRSESDLRMDSKPIPTLVKNPLQQFVTPRQWNSNLELQGHYWYADMSESYNIATVTDYMQWPPIEPDCPPPEPTCSLFVINHVIMPAYCCEGWADNFNYVPGAQDPVPGASPTQQCTPLQFCAPVGSAKGCHRVYGSCAQNPFETAVSDDQWMCKGWISMAHFYPLVDRFGGRDVVGGADLEIAEQESTPSLGLDNKQPMLPPKPDFTDANIADWLDTCLVGDNMYFPSTTFASLKKWMITGLVGSDAVTLELKWANQAWASIHDEGSSIDFEIWSANNFNRESTIYSGAGYGVVTGWWRIYDDAPEFTMIGDSDYTHKDGDDDDDDITRFKVAPKVSLKVNGQAKSLAILRYIGNSNLITGGGDDDNDFPYWLLWESIHSGHDQLFWPGFSSSLWANPTIQEHPDLEFPTFVE